MPDAGYEDATKGMADDLIHGDLRGDGRDGVADRTAADVMRRAGLCEGAIESCLGYRPTTRMPAVDQPGRPAGGDRGTPRD
jgi:hypothetical protein